jgi:hypothetical protein
LLLDELTLLSISFVPRQLLPHVPAQGSACVLDCHCLVFPILLRSHWVFGFVDLERQLVLFWNSLYSALDADTSNNVLMRTTLLIGLKMKLETKGRGGCFAMDGRSSVDKTHGSSP